MQRLEQFWQQHLARETKRNEEHGSIFQRKQQQAPLFLSPVRHALDDGLVCYSQHISRRANKYQVQHVGIKPSQRSKEEPNSNCTHQSISSAGEISNLVGLSATTNKFGAFSPQKVAKTAKNFSSWRHTSAETVTSPCRPVGHTFPRQQRPTTRLFILLSRQPSTDRSNSAKS